MGYCFNDNETVSAGVKRIALEQLENAVQCTRPNTKHADEMVHDIRVAFKKLRALLRLAQTKSNYKALSRENAYYRDAGRLLSDVRDTTAMIAALDKLIEHYSEQLAREAFAELRAPFIRKRRKQQLQKKGAIAEVAGMLASVRGRITNWPISHEGFSALHRGLRRIYKRGRTRRAKVYAKPNVENLHEWRKRVKDLGYQVRLLKPIRPEQLGGLSDEIDRLADYLSDDHDLAILRQALINLHENQTKTRELVALIDQRRGELQIEAKYLGERIYVQKPNDFVRRVQLYWQAWEGTKIVRPKARSYSVCPGNK